MDYKTAYSNVSKLYVTVNIVMSEIDKQRYKRSKNREFVHGCDWNKYKVNINEFVDKFISKKESMKTYSQSGYKFIFEGDRYIIKCDKVGGYLRLYDKSHQSYCLIDGTPSDSLSKTHFKIKKKEEM